METVTEILVDISGSMEKKMTATKQVLLNDILPDLDYSSRIGIKTFSTIGDNNNKQISIVTILPLNKTDKEAIKQKVQSITCSKGGTPIAASIRASVKELSEYAANDKTIILVTDGNETEGGNYVQEAEKASHDGIKCKIHVVGIDLKEPAVMQAKEISKITGGTPSFISIGSGAYNQTTIRNSLTSFYQAVRTPPTIQSTTPNLVNQSTIPITKVEEPEIKHGPKKEAEEKTVEEPRSSESHNPTLDLIIDQIKELRNEISELKRERNEMPDFIEDLVHNEKIRKASEEYLFGILKKKYPDRVKWLNEKGESDSDHDFEIIDLDGTIEYYIECKGTVKNKPTFYMTKHEWRLFLNNTRNYQIYFVKNSFENPIHILIDNLLDWVLKGKLVPYLKERVVVKEERVFLTLHQTTFDE